MDSGSGIGVEKSVKSEEFLQVMRSLCSRLKGNKMGELIESKIGKICSKLTKTLIDVIRDGVDAMKKEKGNKNKKSEPKVEQAKELKETSMLLDTENVEDFVEVLETAEEQKLLDTELIEDFSEEFETVEEKSEVKPVEVGDVNLKSHVNRDESTEEMVAVEVKPFTYSEEGLLRLIRLDLGILDEQEWDEDFDTIELRIMHNILLEEPFAPPRKNSYFNFIEERKEEEIEGAGRADPEIEEFLSEVESKKVDEDDREYGKGEERKKVMGMSDVHIVSYYVY